MFCKSNKENHTFKSLSSQHGNGVNHHSSMTSGMRSDSSMNSNRGVYESPHISVPMKGDTTKIEPLGACEVGPQPQQYTPTTYNTIASDKTQNRQESREHGNSPAGNTNVGSISTTGEQPNSGGYQVSSIGMPQITEAKDAQAQDVSSSHIGLPQRQTDPIFRVPEHKATTAAPSPLWSNVVSSNAVQSTPNNRLGSRSISGETLLTSNMTQTQYDHHHGTSIHYLNSRSRSQSFEMESSSPGCHYNLAKSHSFGNPASSNQQQRGIPPSHPGHSSYMDSTIMYPSTPYHDTKPRYSSSSIGGNSTDQTSPMSSPSVSPYVSPSINPLRKQDGHQPPIWQLDSNAYHSDSPSLHHRIYLNSMPRSIPEHSHHYHHHSRSDPTSPPRHFHSPASGGHHQHSMYHRRPGAKSHTGSPPSSLTPGHHHRSPTEVLKTLLRKKACLFEPETSFAVSLVTWLVGRRLALSQGYFTRQQLQAGVHACVARTIKEGYVTRTKVNRCMQVILNSCYHYIIPRPDGSEESGETFRAVFSREAADEEHLLSTLPSPWNNFNLPSLIMEDESHSSIFFHESDEDRDHPKIPNKVSSSASQAGDSLDSGRGKRARGDSMDSSGGKRSVLLCFNENIRSAADVFRCHNEFIRDVAHAGNLNLTPEEWHSFFSGAKSYNRKKGSAPADSLYFHLADMQDRMDQQGVAKLRTTWCAKRYEHDHSFCAFAHVGINRGWLRRDPFLYKYTPLMCPYVKPLPNSDDCYVNMCSLGVKCNHSHSKEEVLYHPESYKRQPCRNATGGCPLGDICPNIHADVSPGHQSHAYNRHGKRYHDHSASHRAKHSGPKRVSTSTGHSTTGFSKLPEGSPTLYIDPAPLSEFEKTLLLPGLQAIFRDHSSYIFISTMGSSSSQYEYGNFGYRNRNLVNVSTKSVVGCIPKAS